MKHSYNSKKKRGPQLQDKADLSEIKTKLQKLLRQEQQEQAAKPLKGDKQRAYKHTADVKGRIDPSEPDVIQQFRPGGKLGFTF